MLFCDLESYDNVSTVDVPVFLWDNKEQCVLDPHVEKEEMSVHQMPVIRLTEDIPNYHAFIDKYKEYNIVFMTYNYHYEVTPYYLTVDKDDNPKVNIRALVIDKNGNDVNK